MLSIKEANIAGTFYDSDARRLADEVGRLIEEAGPQPSAKAIIAPHAGMMYSGPVAASAYRALLARSEEIERVVLLGPSHYFHLDKITLPGFNEYQVPGGNIVIDHDLDDTLLGLPFVEVNSQAFEREHCLEVQFPFLQQVLKDFKVLPALIGNSGIAEIASFLDIAWGGRETAIVVSSDLSHFHSYKEAERIDRATASAICSFDAESLPGNSACGLVPIKGLLHLASQKNMTIDNVDLRNSGDTGGDKNRVVGYGAFLLHEN